MKRDAEDIWQELAASERETTVGGPVSNPKPERLTMAGARVKRAKSSGIRGILPAGAWRMTGFQRGILIGLAALFGLILLAGLLLAASLQAPHFDSTLPRKEGKYTFLLAGSDQDGVRTDTIMLCGIDTEAGTAAVMSLPRDTLVLLDGAPTKLNALYAHGGMGQSGMEYLRDRVSKMLGVPIDGYALVSLEAFAEAIDLLGGVQYNVPVAMQYDDPWQDLHIDLQPGEQLLNGTQAAHLLRFRSGYYNADLGRIEVQQDFLKALAKQCLRIDKLPKLGSMASILSEELVTDLSAGNLLWLGLKLLSMDELQTDVMPGSADGIYLQGQNYYVIYGLDTLALINERYSPLGREITLADVEMMRLSGQAIVFADGTYYDFIG